MKIFTSLLLLFCLITLGLALPRHKRENVEITEEQEKLDKTTESEIKNEDKLPLLETPSELQSVQEPEPKITKLESELNLNEPKNPNKFNYASLQSQIIATNILKDNIENRGNEVFSPLGISTILAILAEGSQDEGYQEFKNALGYPDDKMSLRESFLDTLKAYKQNDYDSNPSFKTWFYIYRNNSANDEFKDIIRKYYTAEVKEIDDIDFDWDKPEKSASVANEMKKMEEGKSSNLKTATSDILPSTVSVNSEQSGYEEQSEINDKNNSKDIIGFEDLKKSDFFEDEKEKQEEIIPEITESQSSSLSSESESRSSSSDELKEPTISVNTENALLSGSSSETDITNPKNNDDDKMILIKETTGINENLNDIDDIKVIEMKKEASKFDVTVDDKQYVEVPIIKAEIVKENDEKRKREEKESALEIKDSTSSSSSSSLISETTPSKESKEETSKSNDNDDEKKEIAKESNVLDEVLKEIKAEKVALNDFLKEETNQMNDKIKLNTATEEKKLESDAEIAAAAVVDELNKEEKLMETMILMKEPVKEIEVPMENPDTNQIRRIDLVDINDEENETISQDEKIDVLRKHNKDVNNIIDSNNDNDNTETVVFIESKEPEKITLSIKKFDDENGEIMEAVETRFIKQRLEPRSLLRKDDITSALSANSITGRENPSKTKMLLFNGLYYRGNWAHPFMELRCDIMDTFTTTEGKSIPIKMMKTRGSFRMAKLDSLDSDALELPYENERFSFVVIVPKQYDGIDKLIEKLQPVDLQMIQSRLTDTLTTINLPKFEIEQTSKSEKTIKRLGISKIFSPYASSMTKMSDEPGLHVEEIVQHVNLRVDEGAASENALSASNSLGRAMSDEEEKQKIKTNEEEDEKHFDVNRPFLYFVMDRSSNFIIAAGKLLQPQIKEDFGFES